MHSPFFIQALFTTSLNRWQGESFIKISNTYPHEESQADKWGGPRGGVVDLDFYSEPVEENQLPANTGKSV